MELVNVDAQTVANVCSACLIGGLIGGLALFAHPRTRSQFIAAVPSIASFVAVGATAGSLYFSERAGFIPCELCWFQRVAMYPMALILPLAVFRRDGGIMNYAFALAGAGFLVSAYHIRLQWFPERENSCSMEAPCSAKWVEGFGVFTIPQMAAMSFFLIMMLSVASTFGTDARDDLAADDLVRHDEAAISGGVTS